MASFKLDSARGARRKVTETGTPAEAPFGAVNLPCVRGDLSSHPGAETRVPPLPVTRCPGPVGVDPYRLPVGVSGSRRLLRAGLGLYSAEAPRCGSPNGHAVGKTGLSFRSDFHKEFKDLPFEALAIQRHRPHNGPRRGANSGEEPFQVSQQRPASGTILLSCGGLDGRFGLVHCSATARYVDQSCKKTFSATIAHGAGLFDVVASRGLCRFCWLRAHLCWRNLLPHESHAADGCCAWANRAQLRYVTT